MSIMYWIDDSLLKTKPTPKTLKDCLNYSKNHEKASKVNISIYTEDVTGAETGVYISLRADLEFCFSDMQVACTKQLGFFGIPILCKWYGRRSVNTANNKLVEIITRIENAGIKKIKGKTKRFALQDFPYLLNKTELAKATKYLR